MRKRLIIVPSSRYIDFELRSEFGNIPPVLMPIENKNVLMSIYERYNNDCTDIVIGCHDGKELVDQFIKQALLKIRTVDVGRTYDVGHTIYKIMALCPNNYHEIIINFGDTIPLMNLGSLKGDVIVTANVDTPWKWTIVKKQKESLCFLDKVPTENNIEYQTVIGTIKLSQPVKFMSMLHDSLIQSLENGTESLYSSLTQYSKRVGIELLPINKEDWIDVGHQDRLDELRKNMRERSFNSIQIDYNRGIFLKQSENYQKLIQEIKWYIDLPRELHYCIPRIFDYSLAGSNSYVSMEYYGYPSLADIFVHGNLSKKKWEEILQALKWILGEFKKFTLPINEKAVYRLKYQMYVEKTLKRLKEYPLTNELAEISRGFYLNGEWIFSLQDCLDKLEELFYSCIPRGIKHLSVMHGDFCLSNILYDARSKVFKVIDPRGSFGESSVYGDYDYDIAKLSHSLSGYYDFIVREQFYYSRQEQDVVFKPFVFDIHKEAADLFMNIFVNYDWEQKRRIEFIEALLFLSMIPLHEDSKYKQIGMLITGLTKFTKVYKNRTSALVVGNQIAK